MIAIFLPSVHKLSRKANFTQHVRPIALAEAGRGDLSQPQSCLLSGWGRFNNTNEFNSDVLMEVNVTLDERCYCTKHHLYCSVGEDGPGEVRELDLLLEHAGKNSQATIGCNHDS